MPLLFSLIIYEIYRGVNRYMNLKEIRNKRKLSVPALVELSGVPRRTIQAIEVSGDCKVSTALKLSNALKVTLDELCKKEPLN